MDTAQAMELAAKDIADMQKRTPSTVVPHQPVYQLSPSKQGKKEPSRQLLSATDVEEIIMQRNANSSMQIVDHVARKVI